MLAMSNSALRWICCCVCCVQCDACTCSLKLVEIDVGCIPHTLSVKANRKASFFLCCFCVVLRQKFGLRFIFVMWSGMCHKGIMWR